MEHYCYSVRTEEGTFYYDGDDLLHRTDGPAREFSNGECEWFVHGKRHREDGPAVTWPIPRPNKEQEPAVCGYEAWYVNGVRHRADGPAQVYPNGDRVWYFQGELHREDGPAVEESDRRAWYTHGVLVDAPTMVVATT
jgi:hypothetical protein